jgi:hypothetical protein
MARVTPFISCSWADEILKDKAEDVEEIFAEQVALLWVPVFKLFSIMTPADDLTGL